LLPYSQNSFTANIGLNVDKKSGGALTMASAEREPITESGGRAPRRGLGSEPLVRDQGKAPLPLKLKAF